MSERLLTVEDVAELLGVHKQTVYRLKDKPGGIPAYKVGHNIRFKAEEVDAYITAQAVQPLEAPKPFCERRFEYKPGMKVVSI